MFVLTILLLIAIGTMLYLMVRALPRVQEESSVKENFLDRWAQSKIPEKIDEVFNGFLIKFLRRVQVAALKFDNAVSTELRKAATDEKGRKKTFQLRDVAKIAERDTDEKTEKEE